MRDLLKKLPRAELETLSAEVLRRLDGAAPVRPARETWEREASEESSAKRDTAARRSVLKRVFAVGGGGNRDSAVFDGAPGAQRQTLPAGGAAAEAAKRKAPGFPDGGEPGVPAFAEGSFAQANPAPNGGADGFRGGDTARRVPTDSASGGIAADVSVPGPRAAAAERGAAMREVSDFFRRDARRYDNGFELY